MDPRPIYQQIAAGIRDQIAEGTLVPGDRAPSTNELSAFHSVNPTTSAKALTLLFEEGLLEKRRGLGMFVLDGARENILRTRRKHFSERFIRPLLAEAQAIGLSPADVSALITKESDDFTD